MFFDTVVAKMVLLLCNTRVYSDTGVKIVKVVKIVKIDFVLTADARGKHRQGKTLKS